MIQQNLIEALEKIKACADNTNMHPDFIEIWNIATSALSSIKDEKGDEKLDINECKTLWGLLIGFRDGGYYLQDCIKWVEKKYNLMPNLERMKLIQYIYDFAWHYGRLYHIGDAEQIKAAISEKFQLPEEFLSPPPKEDKEQGEVKQVVLNPTGEFNPSPEELEQVQKEIDEVNKGAIVDRQKLSQTVFNAIQLIGGLKQDAEEGKYWTDWDEEVYQSLLKTLEKLNKPQPTQGYVKNGYFVYCQSKVNGKFKCGTQCDDCKKLEPLPEFEESLSNLTDESKRYIDANMAIVEKIHSRIGKLGITQKELADRMGKTEAEISRALKGEHNLTLRSICKYEVALNFEILSFEKPQGDVKQRIEDEARKQRIYEPKYGGKDHSGYDTLMKYEVNDEREEAFIAGATFALSLSHQTGDESTGTDKYKHCNHHHELTEDYEVVDFGDGEFVANKIAVPLLKALNEFGLRTRSHHIEKSGEGWITILLDNVELEIRKVHEVHSTRDKYNGKQELLIRWQPSKPDESTGDES